MREILFRGKLLRSGDWLYGVPLKERSGKVLMYTYDESGYVDPATVGQYTGLTDTNGVKIFEGDVVEGCDFNTEDGYGLVQWDDGAFEVVGNGFFGTFHENYFGTGMKVIGNIHDNPELLEGDDHE